jgi:outer membrane protein assembly factor BamA
LRPGRLPNLCALIISLALALLAGGRASAAPSTDDVDVVLPARIDAIVILGLVRTKERVVLRELPWHLGTVVSRADFDLGVARLWNTTMFSRVAGRVVRRGGLNVAVLDLEERFPIRPLAELQTGGSATSFQLGVSDRNILGEYLELEAYYAQFDGKAGGSVWFRDARLFDQRLELVVVADRLMRSRPSYLVRTTRGRLELNVQVMRDFITFGTRFDLRSDDFFQPLQGSNPALPSPVHAAIAEPGVRIGRIDTIRLRRTGFTFEVRPSLGDTSIHGAPAFRRLWLEGNAKAMAGRHWNFDLRAQFGTVTNAPDEMQFFIGGLDVIRGYPDNYFQGNACAVYNADVKYVLFDSRWLAVIPEAFSDGAAIRRAVGTTDAAVSAGGGVVLVIPKLVDSFFRIDVAVPLRQPYAPALSTGTQLFF